jgi:hypothetical protein
MLDEPGDHAGPDEPPAVPQDGAGAPEPGTGVTVTLVTVDHGPVTLPEPAWCDGHDGHQPDAYRVDLTHSSPVVPLTFRGRRIGRAVISQAPCAERGTRDVQAFVGLSYESAHGFDPSGLYDLAASLNGNADRLRNLADQLAAILAGGEAR